MSATIWTVTESGSDCRPATPRRQGYWSGNQGRRPVRTSRLDDDSGLLNSPARPVGR
jgi:hypothetical protein